MINQLESNYFLLKTKYNTDNTELETKIPDVSNLVK